MDISQSQIVSFIWSIADECLRDVFLRGQYRDVILPMVVLRRFDALLEPTKDAVDEEVKSQKKEGIPNPDAFKEITHQNFYNTSKWTLNRIKSQATNDNNILYSNFKEYLNGYSDNVKDVLRHFKYYEKAQTLAESDRLLAVIEKITDPHINLTDKPATDPDGLPLPPVSNIAMGTIFEELLRRFNEENNEEAGEHFTPRDAIHLLARLVFEPVGDNLPPIVSIYDPAEGSGGMLTESREYLLSKGLKDAGIKLYGTEVNPETYAICKSDLIIKGVDPSGMHLGNTITENFFGTKEGGIQFGYIITNPPYGKSWKTDKDKIYHDKQLLDTRFLLTLENFFGDSEQLDCTPRTSDGQLLFLLEEVNKFKPLTMQPQGSRAASIHNGSSLFTGDAGSGESNTRRYLIENDFVEAIIQLPNNIFYNTGISTYVWLLSNKKQTNRRGKVQLIDASEAYEKLRKNQGSRNCTITEPFADMILKAYMDFCEQEANGTNPVRSKILTNDDFRYYSVTIERPLRLRSQFSSLLCDALLFESSRRDLSEWLFHTYSDKVFNGLEKQDILDIKEYLQENDIRLTDKQVDALTDPKKWCERRALKEIAHQLLHAVGTDVYMDYNIFSEKVHTAAKQLETKVTDAQQKTIARAMSVADPDAQPVIKKIVKRNSKEVNLLSETLNIAEKRFADYGLMAQDDKFVIYEPDSELRDTENIPVREDIYNYFQREVRPYVADAWIDIASTKIGCEISFNKYFYRPKQLGTLADNSEAIRQLDEASKDAILQLLNAK